MFKHHRIIVGIVAATTALGPLALSALTAPAGATPSAPRGVLVSARAALHDWRCDTIADEKFSCNHGDPSGPGFTVVLRSIRDLPKWLEEDPAQIAYVARHWFVTVEPNPELSTAEFTAVKRAVARHR